MGYLDFIPDSDYEEYKRRRDKRRLGYGAGEVDENWREAIAGMRAPVRLPAPPVVSQPTIPLPPQGPTVSSGWMPPQVPDPGEMAWRGPAIVSPPPVPRAVLATQRLSLSEQPLDSMTQVPSAEEMRAKIRAEGGVGAVLPPTLRAPTPPEPDLQGQPWFAPSPVRSLDAIRESLLGRPAPRRIPEYAAPTADVVNPMGMLQPIPELRGRTPADITPLRRPRGLEPSDNLSAALGLMDTYSNKVIRPGLETLVDVVQTPADERTPGPYEPPKPKMAFPQALTKVVGEGIREQRGSVPDWWAGQERGWAERPETVPGEKGAYEILGDLTNIPGGWVTGGGRLAANVVRGMVGKAALEQTGKIAARETAERAAEAALKRYSQDVFELDRVYSPQEVAAIWWSAPNVQIPSTAVRDASMEVMALGRQPTGREIIDALYRQTGSTSDIPALLREAGYSRVKSLPPPAATDVQPSKVATAARTAASAVARTMNAEENPILKRLAPGGTIEDVSAGYPNIASAIDKEATRINAINERQSARTSRPFGAEMEQRQWELWGLLKRNDDAIAAGQAPILHPDRVNEIGKELGAIEAYKRQEATRPSITYPNVTARPAIPRAEDVTPESLKRWEEPPRRPEGQPSAPSGMQYPNVGDLRRQRHYAEAGFNITKEPEPLGWYLWGPKGGLLGSYPSRREADAALKRIAKQRGIGEEAATYATDVKAPTFYSALERAIDAKMPNRAAPEQIRGILQSGGVKPDEIKWTGFDDFLNERMRQGKPVTRQEALDHVRQNQVQIQEVTKGDINARKAQLIDQIDAARGTPEEQQLQDELTRLQEQGAGGQVKFDDLVVPGGENYRELLLTLPGKPGDVAKVKAIREKAYADFDAGLITREERNGIIASADQWVPEPTKYQSGHWDEPNVLAHVRFNDRVTSDGKKVLFLEEIQSDWHQAGRQKGYRTTERAEQALVAEDKGGYWEVRTDDGRFVTNAMPYDGVRNEAEAIAMGRRRLAEGNVTNLGRDETVPPAPFAKTWPDLVLKRMIRYASENGYDSIAWTTGKQQAERYDLAKQVADLSYLPNSNGTYDLMARTHEGRSIDIGTGITSSKLPDMIGKDIANKITAGEGVLNSIDQPNGWRRLSGLDLKVGGEGMQGFYDEMLPESANKLGKKFGARVGDTLIGGERVHSLAITPAMKNAALSEGFPLFMAPETVSAAIGGTAGYATTPEGEDPWQRAAQGAIGAAGITALARGGLKGLRKLSPGGTLEHADEYLESFTRRSNEIEERLAEIEPQLEKALFAQEERAARRELGHTIERPPRAGRLTNEQLEEIAAEAGVSPYQKSWWEAVDPEAFKERGVGRRSGKYKLTPLTDRGELDRLDKEWKALTAEKERLNAEYERRYQQELERPEAELVPPGPSRSSLESPESSAGTPPALGKTVPGVQPGKALPSKPSPPESIVTPEGLTLKGQGAAVKVPKTEQEAMFAASEPGARREFPRGAKPAEPAQQADLLGGEQFEDDAARARIEREQALKAGQQELGVAKEERIPLWKGKSDVPPPPEPPAPPTGPPPDLPSGRKPGGQGKPLTGPLDPYTQLVGALTPTKPTKREAVADAMDALLTNFYDRNYGLYDLQNATGIPVHKLAQVVPGSTAYGEYLVEAQVMPVLQGMGKDLRHLEEYMVASRFQDLLARNPEAKLPGKVPGWWGTFQSLEGLKRVVGAKRYKDIQAAAKKLWSMNDELVLKPRLEAGLLNKEQYTALTSAHPHYISFYREEFAGLQTSIAKTGRAEANVTNAGIDMMDLEGSWRKLDRPLARFAAQVITTQRLVSENKAAKAITEALLEMEKGTSATHAAKAPLGTGERFARVLGPREAAENSNIWGTVSYLEDGKKIAVQVPAEYATIAKGLEAETADFVSKTLAAISAPLRGGAVTYNPAFVIINPIRDAISAWYRTGLQPISRDYIAGWAAAINKNGDFADAAKAGALMSGIVDNMRTTEALERAARLGKIEVRNAKDALLVVPRLIQRANMVSEQATRIAVYRMSRSRGLSALDAAIEARDATVDFAKSGHVLRLINQLIPFTNASLQGTANTVRLMRDKPMQALVAGAPLGAASVMAWVWNQRYETASMIPDYEYVNSWVIQVGEGEKTIDPKYPNKPREKFPIYIKIPKGPLGAVLTAPVEMLLRYAWQQDDRGILENLKDVGSTIAAAASPVEPSLSGVLPPIAGTFVGIGTNVDTFRGQPIVPRSEQGRPPELQFGPETSQTAVALGERFQVSPRLIEWAIRDYTAGAGQQTNWLADMVLGAVGYDTRAPGAEKKQAPSDIEQTTKTPLVSRFVGTRNTREDTLGWQAFDKAVLDSQRQFASVPEVRRLGTNIGPVGETITVDDLKVRLEPKERAELQTAMGKNLSQVAGLLAARPDYQKLPFASKAKVMSQILAKMREVTEYTYLGEWPEELRRSRAIEALPVPVNRSQTSMP